MRYYRGDRGGEGDGILVLAIVLVLGIFLLWVVL